MSENIQNLQDASVDAGVPKALNYIEKLVAELCPEGVDIFTIDELISLEFGVRITKSNQKGTKYPVYGGGGESFRTDDYNRKDNYVISRFAMSEKCVRFVEGKFWMLDSGFTYSVKHDFLNYHYMGYWLLAHQSDIYNCSSQSAQKNLKTNNFKKFEVPVPPLKVQNAIVEILDKFTELEAELEAELAARRAQYEYYRKLLLEDITNRVSVERVELSEIFDISNGYTPKKSVSSYWDDGNVPWFRMEDIRRNGRVLSESLIKVHESAVKKSGLFPENSIIVATSATIGEHALIKIPFLCNQRFTALILKEKYINKLDRKFLFYYCFVLDEWCRNNTTQSSFASVDMKGFRKFVFPVPSLTDQERIVSILDTFDALVNDISSGLPAELEARRKQYEYYRDRLLTFPRKSEPDE